jgi:hypothetical protein
MILEVTVVDEHGEEPVPREFRLGVANHVVCEIIDRWLATDYSYFKLRADDKAIYILRHDKLMRRWELILFNQQDV